MRPDRRLWGTGRLDRAAHARGGGAFRATHRREKNDVVVQVQSCAILVAPSCGFPPPPFCRILPQQNRSEADHDLVLRSFPPWISPADTGETAGQHHSHLPRSNSHRWRSKHAHNSAYLVCNGPPRSCRFRRRRVRAGCPPLHRGGVRALPARLPRLAHAVLRHPGSDIRQRTRGEGGRRRVGGHFSSVSCWTR